MIQLEINENDNGQRLDRFLRKYFNGAPLSLIYKMIRKDVKINGKRGTESTVLSKGDLLTIYIPEEKAAELHKEKKIAKVKKQFRVAYEDDSILVVSKPAGLLTHGDGKEKKNTLANQVTGYLAGEGAFDPAAENTFVPAPLNRLDRNTTGLVLFAKNAPAARKISEMLRSKEGVRKIYRAVCCGRIEEELVLDAALEKNEEKNIVKLSVGDGAKRSVTIVRPLKHSRAGDYTLVEAELVTGRTHQIRVHLSGAGHPLIGDQKYGDVKVNAYFKKKYGLTSQLLHAERLEFAGDAEILPGKSVRARTSKMFREIEKDLF